MSEEIEQLSEDQIGEIVRSLLGPEEEWDDFAAEFVLSVYGKTPESSGSYLRDLIFKDIDARKQRGEAVDLGAPGTPRDDLLAHALEAGLAGDLLDDRRGNAGVAEMGPLDDVELRQSALQAWDPSRATYE